jgi:Bacterial capsule synthesis protein PGA_cap
LTDPAASVQLAWQMTDTTSGRQLRGRAWGLTWLAVVACSTTPAPEPAPVPTTRVPPPVVSRSDSARERARADSARAARPARAVPVRPVSRIAHPSARNDTLTPRVLHAPVRVCAGGDVTLGTNLFPQWAKIARAKMRAKYHRGDDPATLLAPLRPLLRGADVVLLNVESAIGKGPAPSKCGPTSTNCFAFRSPPSSARALRAVAPKSVIVGNVANNHARDAGKLGHDSTVAALVAAGVLVTGDDTLATAVVTPAGDTIGVLGFYTSSETPDARDTAAVYRHVLRAAEQYPLVIATMHLGAEGQGAQNTRDTSELYLGIERGNPVAFADAAVRGGAALVVGHGPHVMRAMEWRQRGALIAYSLGNLLTYGPFVLKEPLNRGAVLCASFDRAGRVASATMRPTVQRAPGVLAADRSARAADLVDSLGRLDFPATGARVGKGGVVRARTEW